MRAPLFAVVLLGMTACGYVRGRPSTELKERTAKLERGMSDVDVQAILGAPDQVDASLCGGIVQPRWKCTMWRYQAKYLEGSLVITFQSDTPGSLTVNDWEFNGLRNL